MLLKFSLLNIFYICRPEKVTRQREILITAIHLKWSDFCNGIIIL